MQQLIDEHLIMCVQLFYDLPGILLITLRQGISYRHEGVRRTAKRTEDDYFGLHVAGYQLCHLEHPLRLTDGCTAELHDLHDRTLDLWLVGKGAWFIWTGRLT